MSKPVPIDLTRHGHLVEDAREFLRLWIRDDARITCFVNPKPVGPDPAGFGVALAEAVTHAARAWAGSIGISEAEAAARIWEGVDATRGETAVPNRAAPPAPAVAPDDDIITYTGKPH